MFVVFPFFLALSLFLTIIICRQAMDSLGLKRYCCRRMVLTHVNLIDKLLAYHTFNRKEEVSSVGISGKR